MSELLKNKVVSNKQIDEVHSKIGVPRLKAELFFIGDVLSAVLWAKLYIDNPHVFKTIMPKKWNDFMLEYHIKPADSNYDVLWVVQNSIANYNQFILNLAFWDVIKDE